MKPLGISLCMYCCNLMFGNVLVNPGFETGDFTGWAIGGTSTSFGVATTGVVIPGTDPPFTPAFVIVHSGTFAAYANVSCESFVVGCTPRLIFTLSQTITVSPNSMYSVGFYLANASSSPMGVGIGDPDTQIFVDGLGILQPPRLIDFPNDGFQLFSGSFSTGASNTATITFQINGSGSARAGLSIDDFFVQPAPEPKSFPLLFIAALIVIWRQGRSAHNGLTRNTAGSRLS